MAIPDSLLTLIGSWQGQNQLWLAPGEPVRQCATTAVCRAAAQGKFLIVEYTWVEGGQPQDGVLTLSQSAGQLTAVWIDSWHMQDVIMSLSDASQPDAPFSVRGAYAAPPDPDWGWRITLQPQPPHIFTLLMHNMTPDGQEALAVEAIYQRENA